MVTTKNIQGKSPEKDFYGAEISNLPDKEFKVRIIKLLNKLGRQMDKQQ